MTKDSIRIVSLIPSGTEILAALGLTNAIVGRSHECDFPSDIQNIPTCTQARLDSMLLVRKFMTKLIICYNLL